MIINQQLRGDFKVSTDVMPAVKAEEVKFNFTIVDSNKSMTLFNADYSTVKSSLTSSSDVIDLWCTTNNIVSAWLPLHPL
jgi:hypothetical protein